MRRLFYLPFLIPAALQGQPALERLFYYVDREDSYESFVKHADRIDVLGVGGYRVDSLGILWGSVDRRVLDLARQRNVKVMPLLVNENFHQPSLRRLLADTAARNRATRAMAEECRLHKYWGWQFDIENVHIDDRDRLTTWYGEAARALHAAGCTISIAVVHRPTELAGPLGYHRFLFDSWRAAYDLAALARLSDFVTIMTYSQHTRRTTPGPQAGIPWMRSVVDYVLHSVPAAKLSLGIPSQGLHYFTREDNTIPERARSWAETVNWTWGSGIAERYGARLMWDSTQAVTYGSFENGGTFEWLFLEDERSFRAKLALAREKKLRGFSVWVLGQEDERIWEALKRQ
jgi:spore germination protein YaaH